MPNVSNVSCIGRGTAVVVALAGGAAVIVALVPMLRAQENQPVDIIHNVFNAPAPDTGVVFGTGPAFRPGDRICTTPTQTGPNVDTDCERPGITNETSIAVNPTNPANMIGGANDYQVFVNPGGQAFLTFLSRAHVTFDGGQTWSEYPIRFDSAYVDTGDPALAFDADGHAYYATLGFRSVGPINVLNPDILVAHSADGGKTWTSVRVAEGSGNTRSVGDALDKGYIAAWGHGNALVTFGDFRVQQGVFVTGRIFSCVTHDAGQTWSSPTLISSSLDVLSYVSVPTVAADGRIYVAFLNFNFSDLQKFRDDYEVVEVSPLTGERLAGPFKVATTIDGFFDYPRAFGRRTYQDSLFRTWAAGNITGDSQNASHLAVVWSDMRNSTLPAQENPYTALTDSDVIVSQSFDNGRTWSTPVALLLRGDQFMPWGAYDTNGKLRIGFFDRQYDAANHKYGYTLATETAPGALTFTTVQLTTTLSDPTQGNRFFSSTVNQLFPFATTFLGDFSNIAATPSGGVVAYWTDLRNQECIRARCGFGQDAYFRQAP